MKFCLHFRTCGFVSVMLRACDFVKLILKCAMNWNRRKSFRRFGRVMEGLDRKSRMLLAKAVILYCLSAMVTPWISIFLRNLGRKGLKVRTNNMGDREHTWSVPF